MRRVLLLALPLAALLVALRVGSRRAPRTRRTAGKPFLRTHDRAVFGHFATAGAANALAKRAKALGFQGIVIENDGCGDYEVLINGADKTADRTLVRGRGAEGGIPGHVRPDSRRR